MYYPFYEEMGSYEQKRVGGKIDVGMNIEKIEFLYKGELILNKEAEIFV